MPNARHIILLANSKSGSDAAEALQVLATALQARGNTVETFSTEIPAELPALARKARVAKPDIAVAYGGDGTVNTLANALAGSNVAMGIAPDLARFGDVTVVDPEKEFKTVKTLPQAK